ncbi:hypothetical protein MTO96_049369 [Rhipicephalus appendiculatus]
MSTRGGGQPKRPPLPPSRPEGAPASTPAGTLRPEFGERAARSHLLLVPRLLSTSSHHTHHRRRRRRRTRASGQRGGPHGSHIRRRLGPQHSFRSTMPSPVERTVSPTSTSSANQKSARPRPAQGDDRRASFLVARGRADGLREESSTRPSESPKTAWFATRRRTMRRAGERGSRRQASASQRGMTAGSGRRARGRTGRCAPGGRANGRCPSAWWRAGEPALLPPAAHTDRGGEYGCPPARPVTTTQPPPRGASGRERRRTSVVPARERPATCGLASPTPSTERTLPARAPARCGQPRYGYPRATATGGATRPRERRREEEEERLRDAEENGGEEGASAPPGWSCGGEERA